MDDDGLRNYHVKESYGARLSSLDYDPTQEVTEFNCFSGGSIEKSSVDSIKTELNCFNGGGSIEKSSDDNIKTELNCFNGGIIEKSLTNNAYAANNNTNAANDNDNINKSNDTNWINFFSMPGICVTDIAKQTLSTPLKMIHFFDFNDEEVNDIRAVRFISFQDLKKFPCLPKYNDNKDICIDFLSIKRQHSLFIYVSHTWLRDQNSIIHPDNSNNDKFNLIISAIDRIQAINAKLFSQLYIWIDYCCTNQDNLKSTDYEILDKVIEACDIILTPIIDEDFDSWNLDDTCQAGYLHDYKAKAWNLYLNNSWTYLELLLAASIPLYPDTDIIFSLRKSKASNALKQAMVVGRRPHFIYGTKEERNKKDPYLLPGMYGKINKLLKDHGDPRMMYISKESDRKKIDFLYDKLITYIFVNEQIMISKKFKGKSTIINDDGEIYSGDLKNDLRHGRGFLIFPNGSSYKGKFINGKFHDKKGVFVWASGDSYYGGFVNGSMEGDGVFSRACDGYSEHGIWKDDKLTKSSRKKTDEKCILM